MTGANGPPSCGRVIKVSIAPLGVVISTSCSYMPSNLDIIDGERADPCSRKGFEMGETAESRATVSDRIRAIEDRLEIYNLVAGHPPSADTGADYYAETVYAEDGVFDR